MEKDRGPERGEGIERGTGGNSWSTVASDYDVESTVGD